MNVSSSGTSWTFGTRGSSVTTGKRGVSLNFAGTNFSSNSSKRKQVTDEVDKSDDRYSSIKLIVSISDDGTISFSDTNGNPVSDELIDKAKRQNSEIIKNTIQNSCDEINRQVDALDKLHLCILPPENIPSYTSLKFNLPSPTQSTPKVPGFFEKLFKKKVAAINAENKKAETEYLNNKELWNISKVEFETRELKKKELVESVISGDTQAMEIFFTYILKNISWPRETLVSFEFSGNGTVLNLDVDLPEIENMPKKTASVPKLGLKLSIKELSAGTQQKLYAKHVHSIAFRLIGEAFSQLPSVKEVIFSTYSQRINKTTGHQEDEYLLSVHVEREKWSEINFGNLEVIDIIETFEKFSLKRNMTKTGVFKAIQPYEMHITNCAKENLPLSD